MSRPGRSDSAIAAAAADTQRIDKWLWVARFFRSRSLAQTAVENGRVLLAGQRVKLSRQLRAGDVLTIRIGDDERTVMVRDVDDRRGPAPQAQMLYEETPDSLERREARRQQRRIFVEPGESIEGGRPTKRDRRQLAQLRGSDGSRRGGDRE